MIITKEQLQKIIKEELQEVLKWGKAIVKDRDTARAYVQQIKKRRASFLNAPALQAPEEARYRGAQRRIYQRLKSKLNSEWGALSPEMQKVFIEELKKIAGKDKDLNRFWKSLGKVASEKGAPAPETEETPTEETPTDKVVVPFNSEDEYTANTHRRIFKGTIKAYKAMIKEPDSVEDTSKQFQENLVKEKNTFLKKFTKTKFLIQKKIINTYAEDLKKISAHIRSALAGRRRRPSESGRSAVLAEPTAEQMRAEEQLVYSLEELHKQLKKINLESARKVAKGVKWKTTHV